MMPIDLPVLASTCAPAVHPVTMSAVVRNESGANPFAIGVVGGHLARQPRTQAEAEATAAALERAGWNYSVGLAQVNRANFARYGLAGGAAFDPCANLRAGSEILADCYRRASITTGPGQRALRHALSCYYSGNPQRGFKTEQDGTSYVQRVVAQAQPAGRQDSARDIAGTVSGYASRLRAGYCGGAGCLDRPARETGDNGRSLVRHASGGVGLGCIWGFWNDEGEP